MNGSDTAGRVEVKINNEWGTICGNDFTKNEAVVICGQLGYFDGVALGAGHHGGGTGEVLLQGVTCSGTEKTLKDCVWSGYKSSSGFCDHSSDAAVRCYYNCELIFALLALSVLQVVLLFLTFPFFFLLPLPFYFPTFLRKFLLFLLFCPKLPNL